MDLDHTYDTKGPFLLRLVGQPIFDDAITTNVANRTFLGVMVAGHVVNGKW